MCERITEVRRGKGMMPWPLLLLWPLWLWQKLWQRLWLYLRPLNSTSSPRHGDAGLHVKWAAYTQLRRTTRKARERDRSTASCQIRALERNASGQSPDSSISNLLASLHLRCSLKNSSIREITADYSRWNQYNQANAGVKMMHVGPLLHSSLANQRKSCVL